MLRIANEIEGEAKWFSEESDWNNKDGDVIAIWEGCVINEEEYRDFEKFVLKESKSVVEPIGSFESEEGLSTFVFLVKSNIPHFSLWRFKLSGMRWWYDAFWETNGGRVVKDSEILPIIKKLGLTINRSN